MKRTPALLCPAALVALAALFVPTRIAARLEPLSFHEPSAAMAPQVSFSLEAFCGDLYTALIRLERPFGCPDNEGEFFEREKT